MDVQTCKCFTNFKAQYDKIVQAIKEFGNVDVYTANFRPLKGTLSGLPDRAFMKLIVCAKTNKVVGLHICGEDAPEIIQVAYSLLSFISNFS